MWSDDGFVIRMPEGDAPLDPALLVPDPDDVERLVVRQLGSTALFAARFREAAGRALLLPRRRPGQRAPLWQQRKRAADLLAVAARFGSFPIILETYRECLRDVFDLPALVELLAKVRSRAVRVHTVDVHQVVAVCRVAALRLRRQLPLRRRRAAGRAPRPRAVGGPGAAGRAHRRGRAAHAGRPRGAGGARARRAATARASTTPARPTPCTTCCCGSATCRWPRSRRASLPGVAAAAIDELVARRRALPVQGRRRVAAHRRRGCGALPRRRRHAAAHRACPASLVEPAPEALTDLVRRYARTHGPFTSAEVAARLGVGVAVVETTLRQLERERPGRRGRVPARRTGPRVVRRRRAAHRATALAGGAAQGSGAGRAARARPLPDGLARAGSPRAGLDALLDVVERLQGAPLVASVLERELLPARVDGYTPALLDTLVSAGEVTWLGRRAARRTRRPPRALPDRSPAIAGAAGRDRRPGRSSRRGCWPRCTAAARRSSDRSTMRSAAASRRRRSMRCGVSSGRGW